MFVVNKQINKFVNFHSLFPQFEAGLRKTGAGEDRDAETLRHGKKKKKEIEKKHFLKQKFKKSAKQFFLPPSPSPLASLTVQCSFFTPNLRRNFKPQKLFFFFEKMLFFFYYPEIIKRCGLVFSL